MESQISPSSVAVSFKTAVSRGLGVLSLPSLAKDMLSGEENVSTEATPARAPRNCSSSNSVLSKGSPAQAKAFPAKILRAKEQQAKHAVSRSLTQDTDVLTVVDEFEGRLPSDSERVRFSVKFKRALFHLYALGVWCGVLVFACFRLGSRAWKEFLDQGSRSSHLGVGHYVFIAIMVPLMMYCEGFRGFQKKFSPTIVKRSHHLSRYLFPTQTIQSERRGGQSRSWNPPILCCCCFDFLFAFLLVGGHLGGNRKRLVLSWFVTLMVVILCLLASYVSDPWRGLVSFSVLLGLGYGTCTVFVFIFRYAVLGRVPVVENMYSRGLEKWVEERRQRNGIRVVSASGTAPAVSGGKLEGEDVLAKGNECRKSFPEV